MKLLFLLPYATTVIFGLIAIYLSFKNDRHVASLTKSHAKQAEHLSEIDSLKKLHGQTIETMGVIKSREENKLNEMVRGLADGVLMFDNQSKLILINDSARKFLGVGENISAISSIFPRACGKSNIAEKLHDAICQKRENKDEEITISGKTLQVFISPIIDHNRGEVLGASVLLHDITIEKNLAKMKEDFMAMMVHELRAPLSAIKGSSELLLRQGATLKEADKNKLTHLIEEQTVKLIDQVSTFLDAAKIDAGRFVLQIAPADIQKTLQEQLAVFQAEAMDKHIDLVSEIDTAIPKIMVDEARIEQVVNNLLSNSLKYTPVGGKVILHADYDNSQKQLKIEVSDTGIGIDIEKQDHLFIRFAQVTNMQAKNGTGLGLYIIKGIVEEHGGTVTLKSGVGTGTTITCLIPAEVGMTEIAEKPLLFPPPHTHTMLPN